MPVDLVWIRNSNTPPLIAISGSELAVLSTLSPFLLGIGFFRDAVASHPGRCVTRACMLLGMAAYALQKPLHRLFVVSFANMALSIDWAIGWSGLSQDSDPWRTSFGESLACPTSLVKYLPMFF